MAESPSPVEVWLAQLRQSATSDLLAMAAKQRRSITVTLTYDDKGGSKPPRITVA